jgi:hypothetical protein
MKKISFFTLGLIVSCTIFAQQKLTTSMSVAPRFGIKAGANLAEFKVSEGSSNTALPSTQNRGSFNAGFLYNLPLGGMLRLQPELYYSGQGSRFSQSYTNPNYTVNYTDKLGYINLPVLFQYQTTGGFYVELGPQLGYLISAKQDITGTTVANSETNIKDQLKKMDISGAGGIGYLSRVGLGIDARYVYGFREIYDKENNNNTNVPEMKNRVIQFGLFYQFGAGK